MVVRDRDHNDLHRRQPRGEGARVLLDQDAEEPLDRPHQRPVDHDRPVGLAVLPHELQPEALGVVEVHLDRRALPGPPQHVLDLDVDLGAVEHTLAGIDAVRHSPALERRLQGGGRLGPCRLRSHGLLRPGGDPHLVIGKPEGLEHEEGEVQHPRDFLFDLVRTAEQVGVVLREPPHAQQAVQDPRSFIAIDRPQFGVTQRQVTVAPQV